MIVLGGVLATAYVFAGFCIYRHGTEVRRFGFEAVERGDRIVVVGVDPEGPAAGKLHTGDHVVAIDGDTRLRGGVRWTGAVFLQLRRIPPERAFSVRVVREGEPSPIEVRLQAPIVRDESQLGRIVSVAIVSFAFFVSALLIGLSRPGELVARVAVVSSFTQALILLMNSLAPLGFLLGEEELVGYFLLCAPLPLHLALSYDFAYRFPGSIPTGKFWSGLRVLLYAFGFVCFVVFRGVHVAILADTDAALSLFADHAGAFAGVWRAYDGFVLLSMISMCVVLARNYRRVDDPDRKRRIRWVVYGIAIGVTPWVVVSLSRVLLPDDWELWEGSYQAANLALAIIPLTTAYAIVKHRAFDIQVVIRRGLQYLLAKGVLQAVLALQLIGIALLFALNRERTVGELLAHNSVWLYLFGTTALTLGFRERVSRWIDRRFFRASYEGERLLVTLASDIKKLESMPEICRLVSREIDAALHPQGVHVFYRDADHSGDLSLGHSSTAAAGNLRLLEGSSLMRWLEGQEGAVSPPAGPGTLATADVAWLGELRVELLLPIPASDGHLVGMLLLGAKRSEEPFSGRDRKLLEGIAAQIAVVLENLHLRSRVDRERRVREEVLARLMGSEINLLKECPACGACYDSTAATCERDGIELGLSLPIDRVVDGKYRIDQALGKGGMGAVYRARDLRLARDVAVKILHGSRFGDTAALRRFEREARASARLNHPNITAVHDYGRIGADGAYLVMELLRGRTLRAEIKASSGMTPATAAVWFEPVLEGVEAAHRAGVIHRDLKPENVMLAVPEDPGSVKILDFGIAKLAILDEALSSPGYLLGTIGYMSPEQLEGREADARSDLFAMAVMAFEAVVGHRPFLGTSYALLLAAMRIGPERLPSVAPEVAPLQAVLDRGLATNPADRYASAEEMRAALIPALRACPRLPREPVSFEDDTRAFTR